MRKCLNIIIVSLFFGCIDKTIDKSNQNISKLSSKANKPISNSREKDYDLFHDISIPKSWKGIKDSNNHIYVLVDTSPETTLHSILKGVRHVYHVFDVQKDSDSIVIFTYLVNSSNNSERAEFNWVFHKQSLTNGRWYLLDKNLKSYTFIGEFKVENF